MQDPWDSLDCQDLSAVQEFLDLQVQLERLEQLAGQALTDLQEAPVNVVRKLFGQSKSSDSANCSF